MIIITGGAGFIGSNLLKALNDKNLNDILVVEELDRFEKKFNNLENMRFIDCIDKTKTSGGGRLLRKNLLSPLSDTKLLKNRLDTVEAFVEER